MRLHFLLVLPLFLTSCGESDPKLLTDQATEAFQSGRFGEGLGGFESALKHMDVKHAQYMRASLGRFSALAHVDATKAKDEFLKFAAAEKARLVPEDVHVVVSELVNTHQYSLAADVLDGLKNYFPSSGKMLEIGNAVADAAQNAGDSKLSDRLAGLGYVGTSTKRKK